MSEKDLKILKNVFMKYSNNRGSLSVDDFKRFIKALSKVSNTLRKYDIGGVIPLFYFIHEEERLYYNEFEIWWMSKNRYKYLNPPNSTLIGKAYYLYGKYTSKLTDSGERTMRFEDYEKMVTSLGLFVDERSFDLFDKNNNGSLSFKEFFEWLKWA